MDEQFVQTEAAGIEFFKEINGALTVNTLKHLTDVSQNISHELGVLTFEDNFGKRSSYFTRSSVSTAIKEPRPQLSKGREITKAVFYHTHFITPEDENKGIDSLIILPSSYGFSGDFPATFFDAEHATYLNIASPWGLTLNVGNERLSRSEHLTKKLLSKSKQGNRAYEEIWKFRSGDLDGKSFTDRELLEKAKKDKFRFPVDQVMYFSSTQTTNIQHFLYIPWDVLKEYEEEIGGLESLCFEDGVKKLVSKLEINGVFENNLEKTVKKKWSLPMTREENDES